MGRRRGEGEKRMFRIGKGNPDGVAAYAVGGVKGARSSLEPDRPNSAVDSSASIFWRPREQTKSRGRETAPP